MEPTEESLKKHIRINKFKIWMDIILILVLIAIGIYILINIEEFKILGKDVCQLCMQKTGSICYTNNFKDLPQF